MSRAPSRLRPATTPRERKIICDCRRLLERVEDEEDRFELRQIAQRAIVSGGPASQKKAKEAGDS